MWTSCEASQCQHLGNPSQLQVQHGHSSYLLESCYPSTPWLVLVLWRPHGSIEWPEVSFCLSTKFCSGKFHESILQSVVPIFSRALPTGISLPTLCQSSYGLCNLGLLFRGGKPNYLIIKKQRNQKKSCLPYRLPANPIVINGERAASSQREKLALGSVAQIYSPLAPYPHLVIGCQCS